MLTDFAAFVVFAVICSVGFLLSFHILGNGQLTLGEISWLLVKVFLGSSYRGWSHVRENLAILTSEFAALSWLRGGSDVRAEYRTSSDASLCNLLQYLALDNPHIHIIEYVQHNSMECCR